MQEKRDGQNALWNHMGKLSVLATKTVDQDERKWVMDALEDLQTSGAYQSGDLSKNILQGDKCHVGIIALLIFKFKLLRRWTGFMFTSIGLRSEDVSEVQERTKGHKAYFAAAGLDADQSWIGKLKPSAVAAFRLLEAQSSERHCKFAGNQVSISHSCTCLGWTPQAVSSCVWQALVFKRSHDHVMREMSKLSNGVDALLEQGPVQKEWQDIKQLVEQEVVEAKALEQAEASRTRGGGADVGSSASAGASADAGAGSSASAGASADFIDRLAKEHVRAYVKLIQEPTTTNGVELAVKQSSLCTIHGQERRNVFMILLSCDNLAEIAGRAPHRRPPIEFNDLKKLVHGALLGRGGTRGESEENPVSIIGGDVVAMHDGGRMPVQAMFVDLWKPTHKVLGTVVKHSAVEVKLKKVTLVLNEESVRQLKWRVRGNNAYTLVHSVSLASEQELVPDMCPEKQRSLYTGYNIGDAMAFINLEPYNKVWQAEVQKKRDIYGARMLISKEDDKDTEPPKKDDLQPVFFHQLPVDYYLELIHSYNVVGMLDLAAGGGHAAQACLTKRIPYLGFGLTETHVVELEKFLVSWVRDMMGTEGHPLCRKGVLAPRKDDKEKDKQKDKEKGKEKDKERDKEKDKEKKRKAVLSSDGSEAGSDEESEIQKKKRKSMVKKKKAGAQKRKKSSDESGSDSF